MELVQGRWGAVAAGILVNMKKPHFLYRCVHLDLWGWHFGVGFEIAFSNQLHARCQGTRDPLERS